MNQTCLRLARLIPRRLPLQHAWVTLAVLCCVLGLRGQADQFVQVTDPGWTNTTQYSLTGAWGDYDKDGFLDLFVSNAKAIEAAGPSLNFLYHNQGDGTFIRQTPDQVGPVASDKDESFSGYWGDVNNDGFLDLLVMNGPERASSPPVKSRLYLNLGHGAFRSADGGGLTQPWIPSGWGGLADYDNDGWLDAFVCTAWAEGGHRTNLLFHGRGDGTFSLATNSVVATDRSSYSNDGAWGDLNNDGLPDLVVANAYALDFLYRNDGHGQFTRLSDSVLEGYRSWHYAWGDYNNDGFLDLAATASGTTRLFANSGSGDFELATSWAVPNAGGPVWADYDNDGFLDLLVVRGADSPAPLGLFRNNGDGTFAQVEDVFTRLSANWFSGAWGDYDNDGFLDLFVAETTGRNALYRNLGNTNHWIKLQLEGVAANRAAIGAKVRVKATIDGKASWQMLELSASGMYQNDLRPNFGLGDATNVDIVRIEWPSGNVQELTNLAANQRVAVKESVNITPANPSASLNGSVTLTRTPAVAGASYQWRFDSVDLAGQTSTTLTLENIQASQQGNYSIVVTTAVQTVTNHVFLHLDPVLTKITSGDPVTDVGSTLYLTWGDYDSDGDPDLFVPRSNLADSGHSALYRNNGDGTFTSLANAPLQTVDAWITAAWADLDNDGQLDLIALRNRKPAIVDFNNGNGTFIPLELEEGSPNNIVVFDYNQDGWLDLFLAGNVDWGAPAPSWLYRNNGDKTFTRMTSQEVGPLVTLALGGAAMSVDYDDDGWMDVFCANYGGQSKLFHNNGTGQFGAVSTPVFQSRVAAGAWGDYDNDGLVDLCAAALGGSSYIFRNLGNGNFERAVIESTVQGNFYSASWADYDNDGFLDLFLTSAPPGNNMLCRNNGDGTFTRITTGSPVTEHAANAPSCMAGVWFDYDNDGFLDLYLVNNNDNGTANAVNSLYHNNGNSNAWLTVKPVGTASNRDAVGAKVRVQARYAGQVRWQRRDISGGDVINGNNLYAHFGLGEATNVMTVKIEWPSGAVQELANVAPRQSLTIWEPPAIKAAVGANGACLLTITAEPNQTWRIEGSADLETWQVVATVTNTTPTFGYTDSVSAPMACRFYRVTGD